MAAFKDKIKQRHRDGFWAQGETPEIDPPLARPVSLKDEDHKLHTKPIAGWTKPRIEWKRTGRKTPADQLAQIKELVDSGVMTEKAAKRLIQEVLHPPAATCLEDVDNLVRNFRLPEDKDSRSPYIDIRCAFDGIVSRICINVMVRYQFGWGVNRLKRELTEYLAENLPSGLEIRVEVERSTARF